MNIRANAFLGAATLCVLGCATQHKKPVPPSELVLTSTLPARVVAMCISDHWDDIRVPLSLTAAASLKPTSDGFSVGVVNNSPWAFAGVIADVQDTQTGSVTHFVSNEALNRLGAEQVVRECQ
jgi:hypothetical protein